MSLAQIETRSRLLTALGVLYPLLAVGALASYFVTGTKMGLVLVAGLLAFLVFTLRPAVAAVILLVLWETFLKPKFAEFDFGPLHASVAEMVLLVALIAILRRKLVGEIPRQAYRFTGPVTAFVGAIVFGMLVGIYNGEPIRDALDALRTMLAFAGFFVFREAFRGRSAVFARWLIGITIFGCSMVIVGVLTGLPTTGRTINHVITNGVLTRVERLDPAVLRLMSLVLIMLLCGAAMRRRPLLRWAALAIMIFVEVLSYTRSTWTPLLLVGLVVPALVATRPRWLVLAERTLLMALISAVLLTLAANGALGLSARTAYERLASTVNSSTLNESSLSDRTQNELANALPRIAEHPITGVGLNLPYGAVNADYGPLLDVVSAEDRRFIHNTPVGVWLWLGLPGVLAMLWLAVATGAAAYRVYRRSPRARIGPPIGAAAGLLVLAAQSTFQTNLLYQPALLAFAAGFAFLDIWLAENAEPPGITAAPPPPLPRRHAFALPSAPPRTDR
jgi:O-antigen ligase